MQIKVITIVDLIIFILQFSLFYGILVAPIIDDYQLKKIALILLGFIILHFLTKYGKCGFINIKPNYIKDVRTSLNACFISSVLNIAVHISLMIIL